MKIPPAIPYFKAITAVTGLYAVAWMALEGALWRETLLAALALALAILFLTTRFLGGRTLPAGRFVLAAAVAGLAYGVGLVFMTLFLMALKTGIHAHGPEYTAREVAWVWSQLPLWSGVGALAGLGLGLLAVASRKG